MNEIQEPVTVRMAGTADDRAIERLATLDSARVPGGEILVAERNARVLAALPLGSGRPIADPFEPSAEVVALLELRAAQLRDGAAATRRPGLLERVRRVLRGPQPQLRGEG